MTDLRLDLDTTDFARLVETGRAAIPTLAPEWTDQNFHDPGIMCLELLAWVTDAQVYALSRLSKEERVALAGLVGLTRLSAVPASGLLWPDPANDARRTAFAGSVFSAGTAVSPTLPGAPPFRLAEEFTLSGLGIERLRLETVNGQITDLTDAARVADASFLPFGETPSLGDRLIITCQSSTDLSSRQVNLGIRAAADGPVEISDRERLSVSLRTAQEIRSVPVIQDTSGGLARTGHLTLALPVDLGPGTFDVILESKSGGFVRRPDWQRIAFDVLPVVQLSHQKDVQTEYGTGLPDQSYSLLAEGETWTDQISVRTAAPDGTWVDWQVVDDVSLAEFNAFAVAFDPKTRRLQFGNGLNGARPLRGATLEVAYDVTEGARGNIARSTAWSLEGIAGDGWQNLDPMSGGSGTETLEHLRDRARWHVRRPGPLVSAIDITEGARSLKGLDVAAAALMPAEREGFEDRLSLVVLPKVAGTQSEEWIAEIAARLRPRLPLGQRLTVRATRPVDVFVTAQLIPAVGADPQAIITAAENELRRRIDPEDERNAIAFGTDLALASIKGWLRQIEGVAAVAAATLARGDGSPVRNIALAADERARLNLAPGDITVDGSTR